MLIGAVTDESFDEDVLGSSVPVLVDFWAEWCGPCKQITPILEEIAGEMSERIRVVKLNIDENPNAPARFGVRGIPTLLIFRSGEVIGNKVGAASKSKLKNWIETSIE